MIFKANLAICLFNLILFTLALVLISFSSGRTILSPDHFFGFIFVLSPSFIWAASAWYGRRHQWLPVFCLIISTFLMSIEQWGIRKAAVLAVQQDAMRDHYTSHIDWMLALFLQWALSLPLLAILVVFFQPGQITPEKEKASNFDFFE